jgi:DHA2 family multidrug resistance protein
MVATRQFGACFVVMLITGAILLATTQFLPQLVQQNFGYTATWAGLLLLQGSALLSFRPRYAGSVGMSRRFPLRSS